MCGGGVERHAGSQAAQHHQKSSVPIFQQVLLLGGEGQSDLRRHHERREHFDVEADNRPVERGLRDADHGDWNGIEVNRPADDAGIGAEVAPPEPVAQDDEGMLTWRDSSDGSSVRPIWARTPSSLK